MKSSRTDILEGNVKIFLMLLDNFPDIIHSVDDDGNIVYANNTAVKLLGYTREELLTMNIRDIYDPEIFKQVSEGFNRLKKEGDIWIPESILIAKDGTRIPVEIRSFSIYDAKGNFIRTFSILRDIRKLKELQQELIHSSRLAAIGELASGIAHDINNPLTVIILCQDLLNRQLSKVDNSEDIINKVKELVKDIGRAASAIQRLVEHLRSFSRRVAEKFDKVDLYDSIDNALFLTKNKILKTGVEVNNYVEKGKYFVNGASNQLEQVFMNLIANACDAMIESDTKRITVKVVKVNRDNKAFWKCDVSDTGKGIPDDIKEEIFKAFFTTKPKGEGTGLGLSICRGIVQNHGGELVVESEVGKGSTFSVLLPVWENNLKQGGRNEV